MPVTVKEIQLKLQLHKADEPDKIGYRLPALIHFFLPQQNG